VETGIPRFKNRTASNATPWPCAGIGKVLTGENPGVVSEQDHRAGIGDVRSERGGEPVAGVGTGRLSQRPSFYPQLHARSAEQGGGTGCHASLLRSAPRRGTSGCPSGARAHLRLYPSLHGRQRTLGTVSNEYDDDVGRLSLDGYSALGTQDVHGCEKASVEENIGPFAAFIAKLVRDRLTGSPLPATPTPYSANTEILANSVYMFCTDGLRFLRTRRSLRLRFQQLEETTRRRKIRVRSPLALPTVLESVPCKIAVQHWPGIQPPKDVAKAGIQNHFAPGRWFSTRERAPKERPLRLVARFRNRKDRSRINVEN